jgi:hypothetical protein
MATKTFKIGESCIGGIITAEVSKTKITIINKQWDMSKGTRRSSDQSNAKELQSATFDIGVNKFNFDLEYKVERFLNELTTSYHGSVVIEWLKTKIK